MEDNEQSLFSLMKDRRNNPMKYLPKLNKVHDWNMPGVGRERSEKNTLTARDLPKLGTNQPEELPQIGQNCIDIGDNSADHDT